MSTTESGAGGDHIGTRVESEKKRLVMMRAAQLGHDNMSDYIRALIDDDLDEADLPELE